jgi:hypothetical protein
MIWFRLLVVIEMVVMEVMVVEMEVMDSRPPRHV